MKNKYLFISLILTSLLHIGCWNIRSVPNQIESDSLRNHILYLTNTPEYRNYKNPNSLNLAANYIKDKFISYGYEVEEQKFFANGNEYKNIIAHFENPNQPKIIIGAHYDVCEDQPGADDNASGIAGLLETARIVNQIKDKINYQIEFVAYSLEEPPFFRTEHMGSYHHARRLKENNEEIELMICLEMIGYFTNVENSQNYPIGFLSWFYPNEGNFIAAISNITSSSYAKTFRKLLESTTDLECVPFSGPASLIPGLDFSDHMNYWIMGYDAIMITDTAFLRNHNYHTKEDTIGKLDFEKMALVVKGLINMIFNEKI